MSETKPSGSTSSPETSYPGGWSAPWKLSKPDERIPITTLQGVVEYARKTGFDADFLESNLKEHPEWSQTSSADGERGVGALRTVEIRVDRHDRLCGVGMQSEGEQTRVYLFGLKDRGFIFHQSTFDTEVFPRKTTLEEMKSSLENIWEYSRPSYVIPNHFSVLRDQCFEDYSKQLEEAK